jgi:hypothetical protein
MKLASAHKQVKPTLEPVTVLAAEVTPTPNFLAQDYINALELQGYLFERREKAAIISFIAETLEPKLSAAGFTPEVICGLVNSRISNSESALSLLINLEQFLECGYVAQDLLTLLAAKSDQDLALFDSVILSSLYHNNKHLDVDQLVLLAQLKNDQGHLVCSDFETTCWLLSVGGRSELVQEFLMIPGPDDVSIFNSATGLRLFISNGGTIELAKTLLEIKDHAGNQLFRSEKDIAMLLHDQGSAVDYLLLSARDSEGVSYFSYSEDAVSFLAAGGSLQLLQQFDSIRISGQNGRRYSGFEIAQLTEAKVSPQQAQSYAAQGIDGLSATYIHKLQSGIEFKQDRRPKCLLLVASSDESDFLGTRVFADATLSFYANFAEQYDLVVRAIYSVDDLSQSVERYSEADLLIIAGHGSKKSIAIARDLKHYGLNSGQSPELSLSIDNVDSVARVIDRVMPKDAVLFLDSCATAEGGKDANNLATKLAAGISGRRLIASKTSFSSDKIEVNELYPLDLRIYCDKYHDQTLVLQNGLGQEWEGESWLRRERPWGRVSPGLVSKFGQEVNQDLESSAQLEVSLREIAMACSPVIDLEELSNAWKSIEQLPSCKVLGPCSLQLDYDMTCVPYVFGKLLHETWCPPYQKLTNQSTGALHNTLDYLSSKGYSVVMNPKAGDVVAYLLQPEPNLDFVTKHFGLLQADGSVRSKFRLAPALEHPLGAVPKKYGEFVLYFRKTVQPE